MVTSKNMVSLFIRYYINLTFFLQKMTIYCLLYGRKRIIFTVEFVTFWQVIWTRSPS